MTTFFIALLWINTSGLAQEKPEQVEGKPVSQAEISHEPVDRRDLDLLKKDYEILLYQHRQQIGVQIRELQIFKTIMISIGIGSLLALGISILHLFFWTGNRIKKKIRSIVNKDPKLLGKLIDQADKDRRVRERSKILLLGKGGQETWATLKQLGFRELETAAFPENTELDEAAFRSFKEKQYDLVVFDQLEAEQIDAYVLLSKMPIFVGFSPKRVNVRNNDRINFANSPMTLYTRIQEAARYQELIKT